jgi:membrane-associated phospholipid phosphatase
MKQPSTSRKLLKDNQTFLTLYGLLLLLGIYPLCAWDSVSLLLMVNSQSHPVLDHLFYYITYLGHGITYLAMLCLLFLCKLSYRKLLIGVVSFVSMSSIVQLLKRVIFPGQLRPIALVPNPDQLHLVAQVELLHDLSFPSGHAATIFTAVCFIYLSMPVKRVYSGCLLIMLAVLVSYSRMYLCQHFYKDIYVGMLIGGLVSIVTFSYLLTWRVPAWLSEKIPIEI